MTNSFDGASARTTCPPFRRPKVALIVDAQNWAFHNSARQLQQHLGNQFEFTILSVLDLGELHRVLLLTRDHDLVYFFWRVHLAHLAGEQGREAFEALGLDQAAFLADYRSKRVIASGVFDHLFLDPHPLLSDIARVFSKLDIAYSVSSLKLDRIYNNLPEYQPPLSVLSDGVDLALFQPKDLSRFADRSSRPLVIGWTGNSEWANETEDFKGVHSILRPAIDQLIAQGLPIELRLADRRDRLVPHAEMPQFYHGIDVYVCVSKIEGTPNPVLEAMAAGVPVISTDVGIVREAFGPLQSQFILAERSIARLQDALRRLLVEPAVLKQLSDENLQSVQAWDWRNKAEAYAHFFNAALALHHARTSQRRDAQLDPIEIDIRPKGRDQTTLSGMQNALTHNAFLNLETPAPIDASWLRENTVVCMLFFNKLEQTIESAESFLASGVRLNILDNGSAPAAAQHMREHFANNPRVRIVDAQRNRGVSGGRNMQVAETCEPWLLFADNDITVQTQDWIDRMAVAINACPHAQIFAPRLFNKHEDSFGSMSDFVVDPRGNCAFVATEADFSNAFPGGASLISRRVFERLGGYDEDLFVGFEDFELAIRAWRAGEPLLVRHVADVILIHDHRVSTSVADKATALIRYDQGHIGHSHKVVQSKHGVLLDPNFSAWLREQVSQLTGQTVAQEETASSPDAAHVLKDVTARPRRCPLRVSIEVIVDCSHPDAWFSLRAVAIARDRAINAGLDIRVSAAHCAPAMLRDALMQELVDGEPAGHFGRCGHASDDADGADSCSASPNDIDGHAWICWVGAGLINIDFLIQIAQNATLDPQGQDKVFHPGRLVLAAPDGNGIQLEHLKNFDPFALEHTVTQQPVFAMHRRLSLRHAESPSKPVSAQQSGEWTGDAALRLLARISAAGHQSWGIPDSLVVVQLSSEAATVQKEKITAVQRLGELHFSYEVWVHLEQENLRQVALHLALAAFDWNRLPLVTQQDGGLIETAVIELLRSQLEQKTTHVLLIPWLKRGGADQAAIAYMRCLSARAPQRVLVLTTEPAESTWAARVPDGVQLVEWAQFAPWGSHDRSRRNLAWLLTRMGATTIHVMNSQLGWELLLHEGRRLNATAHTYASLFWYGPSERGKLWGYASEYARRVANSCAVDAFLTDNETFPKRLGADYGITSDCFHCVRHPTAHIVDFPVAPRASASSERPKVLWASRFAPEKCVHLLLKIATQRPQYQFLVFGTDDGTHPELSSIENSLRNLPNVTKADAYDTFESLPIQTCDAFLYTSSSDGMPNVVIEAMANGLPTIAPNVGGVAELVDDTTGWLVQDASDVRAYLDALDAALGDAQARHARASAALMRVRELHSFSAFTHRLAQIPGYMSLPDMNHTS